jgi:hypothetical protein
VSVLPVVMLGVARCLKRCTDQAVLRRGGHADFDDLLLDAASALLCNERARMAILPRFNHVLVCCWPAFRFVVRRWLSVCWEVDEFQDCSALQCVFARLLAGNCRSLFVVGTLVLRSPRFHVMR